MNFYALIIGTEILNARREDKHFIFLRDELAKYGHELFASFIIKDDVELLEKTLEFIKSDTNAILFSFGGIGSTPDDLTREISAKVFTGSALTRHKQFEKDILERFGGEATEHRFKMADLPPNAELLFNPVNNMSGYFLEKRYFFVPGFPQMAHPMISDAIRKYFPTSREKFRFTLLAQTSESTMIDRMNTLPKDVELSSLPIFKDNKPMVELSLSGYEKSTLQHYFNLFKEDLQKRNIAYS